MAQRKRISHCVTKTESLFSLVAIARQKWNKWINCGNFTRQRKKRAVEMREVKETEVNHFLALMWFVYA